MVAYSFKQTFVTPIRSGAKTQTIRADRARHARCGEALQLYTGMRTSHCTQIGTATCKNVTPIRFDFAAQEVRIGADRVIADLPDLDAFAVLDGFEDWRGLCQFWRDNHAGVEQWEGVLIQWHDFKMPVTALMSA